MALSAGQFRIGPSSGRMLVRTRRQGVASKVGHDLLLEVDDWSAQVVLTTDTPAGASLTARAELGSLHVREGTGGVKPLTDKDRGEIESNARQILDVDRNPMATFESTQVTPTDGGGTISGTLALRNGSAPVEFQVSDLGADRYRAVGTLLQSAYGIKPYSAFLGALKLRDEVEVEIEVDLSTAERM
ncbi:YceI family protein [Actinopolymorpha pittospori]|uniref:Polyisoprenoid-binding protein YceI n=1 Tax=Actinopolymorpha pittospori TaxID=648752 RepID=A0A927R6L1_9ACTN|nr:YceI family protein [Actinopolymorpha pittospori]MBE1603244.1 polyisoprenoid-binding protein YceI [Actinopolymorpha pittospori]